MPSPWDVGSARTPANEGFPAPATTSTGLAFSLGHRDSSVTRDEALANPGNIVDAMTLPVSADLENSYGDATETNR